jgi:hypothetical protein
LQIAQCGNKLPENESKESEWIEPGQEEAEFRRRYKIDTQAAVAQEMRQTLT